MFFKKIIQKRDHDNPKVLSSMKEKLSEHATEEGIFQRSDEVAIKNLSTWFKSFGFEHVDVHMEHATEM